MLGLGELLWKYRRMIANPRYRTLGVLTLPYFVLFEFVGPFIEVAGLAIVVTGFVSGALPWQMAAMYAGASVLLAALGSLAAVLVEEVSFSRYPRRRDVLSLVTTALLEPFWFHFLHSWWRAVGMVRTAGLARSSTGRARPCTQVGRPAGPPPQDDGAPSRYAHHLAGLTSKEHR